MWGTLRRVLGFRAPTKEEKNEGASAPVEENTKEVAEDHPVLVHVSSEGTSQVNATDDACVALDFF